MQDDTDRAAAIEAALRKLGISEFLLIGIDDSADLPASFYCLTFDQIAEDRLFCSIQQVFFENPELSSFILRTMREAFEKGKGRIKSLEAEAC